MQFFAVASLFAAGAACAVMPRQDVNQVYDVTNFKAQCISHGGACTYSFDVVQHNNGETTPVSCSVSHAAEGNGNLPYTTGTCGSSSRLFSFGPTPDGNLLFTVAQQVTPSSSQYGYKVLLKKDLATVDGQQSYTGDTSFSLYNTVSVNN